MNETYASIIFFPKIAESLLHRLDKSKTHGCLDKQKTKEMKEILGDSFQTI